VLHPHCLGPILFASCELQTQTLENLLVHGLCCSSNTKTQLAKWPGVHFPYTAAGQEAGADVATDEGVEREGAALPAVVGTEHNDHILEEGDEGERLEDE
jgi:hypothetical protein